MSGRDIIAIGGSAGGLKALRVIVAGLPADLSAALLVVLHEAIIRMARLPIS